MSRAEHNPACTEPGTVRVDTITTGGEGAVLGLFSAALAVEPNYLPQVTSGEVPLAGWFAYKRPHWARVAYRGQLLVGHVSVRRNSTLPGGTAVPDGLAWELGRLVTLPEARRAGVAAALVQVAHQTFGDALWATCVAGGASHALFRHAGWGEFADVTWTDDPAPGVAVKSPAT